MKKIFEYFLKNYQLCYHLEDDNNICYGEKGKGNILIVQNNKDSFYRNKQDINPNDVIWKEWKGVKIPFLFDDNDNNEIITKQDGHIKINYDIVASAFYFLSGWNEHINSQKDRFGRVSYEHSMVGKLDIIKIPVVNYYFDILNSALSKGREASGKMVWGEKSFGVALTHDIDKCNSAWLEGSFSEFKQKRFLSIPKLILKRLFGKDDWFNFELISNIDKKYGDSSTFYFLPKKGKAGKWENADYNISSRKIQKEISILKKSKHEIGVHGSFGTHTDIEIFEKEIAKIGTIPIIGNRFHFLMFDANRTINVLERGNVKYDTSLGFSERIGFRRGTCSPFFLYNFEEDRISNVIEIPLIVMDATLGSHKYMGLSQKESLEKVKLIIDEIIKFNGVLTLLWHNNFFSDYKHKGWREVYIQILEYCKQKNGLMTSGQGIYERIRK